MPLPVSKKRSLLFAFDLTPGVLAIDIMTSHPLPEGAIRIQQHLAPGQVLDVPCSSGVVLDSAPK